MVYYFHVFLNGRKDKAKMKKNPILWRLGLENKKFKN